MILAESHGERETTPDVAPRKTVVREKVRIRFRKDGPLRFVSHNDLMRCWDRLVRRAGLPIRFTEGYNPKPRFSSPLALGLGIIGAEEILELELTQTLEPAQVHQKLADNAVEGLGILSVTTHPAKERTVVKELEYACPIPQGRSIASLKARAQEALAASTCPVTRTHPKKPTRVVDLRPWILDLIVSDEQVVFRVAVVNGATARAEELLRLMDLNDVRPPVVLTRTRVLLA